MKPTKIQLIQEILITQLNLLTFYPLAMTMAGLFEGLDALIRPSLLCWVSAGFLLFLMYLMRCRIKHFVLFALLHLACPIITWFLPQGPVNRTILTLVLIGFCIRSFYIRIQQESFEEDAFPLPLSVGMAAASLYIQHYLGNTEWDNFYTLSLIGIIALYYTNFYLKEYLNFLTVNAGSSGVLPQREIFFSGLRLVGVYLTAGVFLLFVTSQYTWLRTLLDHGKQLIVRILTFIFGLFPDQTGPEPEIYVTGGGGGAGVMPFQAEDEASPWATILEMVALVLILLVILVVLYKAARKLIALIQEAMKRTGFVRKEISEDAVTDIREKCDPRSAKQSRDTTPKFWERLDANHRIRAIYQKKAGSFKPSPILSSPKTEAYQAERVRFYTAREMSVFMDADFASVYEKARYSNVPCTNEDVKQMKENCK